MNLLFRKGKQLIHTREFVLSFGDHQCAASLFLAEIWLFYWIYNPAQNLSDNEYRTPLASYIWANSRLVSPSGRSCFITRRSRPPEATWYVLTRIYAAHGVLYMYRNLCWKYHIHIIKLKWVTWDLRTVPKNSKESVGQNWWSHFITILLLYLHVCPYILVLYLIISHP